MKSSLALFVACFIAAIPFHAYAAEQSGRLPSTRAAASLPGPVSLPEEAATHGPRSTRPEHLMVPWLLKARPIPSPGLKTVHVPSVIQHRQATYHTILTGQEREFRKSEPPAPRRVTRPGPAPGAILEYSREKQAWVVKALPSLSTDFGSTTFQQDGGNNGGFVHIPPDPHGAAGPHHVVSVVNTTLRIHQKNGAVDYDNALDTFFSDESPLSLFDPKVLFDQYAGRWVVVAMDQTDTGNGDAADTSHIRIAVSDNSNPNGTWYSTTIDSKTTIAGKSCWADYPGFAVDEEAIYVTANMFQFSADGGDFCDVRMWIIGKSGFYQGTAVSVAPFDPYPSSSLASNVFSQPAHMFGPGPAGVGTYLVGYDGLTNGTNESVQITRIDDPLGSPTFTSSLLATSDVGDIDNTCSMSCPSIPAAPQTGGSAQLDAGDRRTLDAVWYRDSLWLTTMVNPPSGADAGQATAHWFQVDTSTPGAPALLDQGNISGETIASGTYTFYPAVAINGAGQTAFGFAGSASTIHPGSYYTSRSATDGPGFTENPGTLRAGQGYYDLDFCGMRVRWGDYTGTAVDPSDGCFWVYNEHSLTPGSGIHCGGMPGQDQFGEWGTAFGKFCPSGACPADMVIANESLISDETRKSGSSIRTFGSVDVQSPANMVFKTRDLVRLGPGFVVKNGSTFKVTLSMTPCT